MYVLLSYFNLLESGAADPRITSTPNNDTLQFLFVFVI